MIARRFFVKGRVQGVGFRWFVMRSAQRAGVHGWTRNLPNGHVEVLAQGDAGAVASLAADLGAGPGAARVDAVESIDEIPDPDLSDFCVR